MCNSLRILVTVLVSALFIDTGWGQVANPTVTKIIPQIAVGSFDGGQTKYATTIEIVNPNATSVTVSANFYNEDGSASNLTFATTALGAPTTTNGALSSATLDPNKILVISGGTTGGTTPSTGTIAWARFVTSGPVSIATVFELRNSRTNALQSRVGIQASPTDMAKFVIPRIRDVAAQFDVGFALVNTASTLATITIKLIDSSAATIASRSLTMAGSSHRSMFTAQFFELSTEPAGTNYSFILFDAGNAGQFAAAALAFEGQDQTSFPVDVFR
jgi:hypothetical protein